MVQRCLKGLETGMGTCPLGDVPHARPGPRSRLRLGDQVLAVAPVSILLTGRMRSSSM